jgi:hypothetical protein
LPPRENLFNPHRKREQLKKVNAAKSKFAGLDTYVGTVTNSTEFMRIFALPRRVLDLNKVPDVTCMFEKPGSTMRFWPIQSAALVEAAKADGLFGDIGVGDGKTLISLALPTAMESKKTVLPSQREDAARDA